MAKLLLALIIVFFTAPWTFAQTGEPPYDPVSMDTPAPDAEYPPFFQSLTIPSNGVRLSGFMLGANGKGPNPTALLLHGFPGNEKNLDLAQSVRRAGYNVVFFHYRGAWGSEGDYALATQSGDVAAVLAFLRDNADALRVDTSRLSIIGHSFGGVQALRSTAADKNINCVVGLAVASQDQDAEMTVEAIQSMKAWGDTLFMLNNYSGDKFLADGTKPPGVFDMRKLAPEFAGKSMLLITGSEDRVIPPEVQAGLVAAYSEVENLDLTAEVIPGDHAFSATRIRLQRVVIDWLDGHCR